MKICKYVVRIENYLEKSRQSSILQTPLELFYIRQRYIADLFSPSPVSQCTFRGISCLPPSISPKWDLLLFSPSCSARKYWLRIATQKPKFLCVYRLQLISSVVRVHIQVI